MPSLPVWWQHAVFPAVGVGSWCFHMTLQYEMQVGWFMVSKNRSGLVSMYPILDDCVLKVAWSVSFGDKNCVSHKWYAERTFRPPHMCSVKNKYNQIPNVIFGSLFCCTVLTLPWHRALCALTVTRRVADDLQHLCLCLLSVSVHHSASIIVIALELESSISAKPISHCKWNHCQDEQNRDSSYWSIQDRVSCVWCIFVPERFCRWLYNWFILQVLCSILSIVYICVMGICCPAKPSHSCFYCRYECFKQEHTISLFLITLLLIFSVLVSVVSLILSSSLWRSTTVIFRS